MAKQQKQERFFLQRGPYNTDGGAESKAGKEMVQSTFGGLNELNMIDTGEMTYAKNVCLSNYPMMSKFHLSSFGHIDISGNVVGQVGYKDILFYMTESGSTLKLCATSYDGGTAATTTISPNKYQGKQRVLIYFKDHLLVFPDNVVYTYNSSSKTFASAGSISFFSSVNAVIRDATVYNNRIFCISEQNIYASAYGKWNVWDNYDNEPQSAWATDNTTNGTYNSNGHFTGITAFGGRIVAFHSDYIFEVYNTKNPFRIQDVFALGTIAGASIQQVNGLLYFLAKDGVYRYDGEMPQKISEKLPELTTLNEKSLTKILSASIGGDYYLYTKVDGESVTYVFNTKTAMWTKILNGMAYDALFCYSFSPDQGNTFNIDSSSNTALLITVGQSVYEIHQSGSRSYLTNDNTAFVARFSYNTLGSLEKKYFKEVKLMYSSSAEVTVSVYDANASRYGGAPISSKRLPVGRDSVGNMLIPNGYNEAFMIEIKTGGDIQINKVAAKYIIK